MTAVQAAPDTTVSADTPTFASLDLPQRLVDALAAQDITTPTPVQAAVVPDALAGQDVLGRAQTGSGKTLAFGLPLLAKLAGRRSRPKHPRALIIVPTRELATQVRRSMEPLADALRLKLTTIYGGTPYDRQIRQLRNGADIVVATPGRLEDLIERGNCRTDDVEVVVLDEADHLCDLGFYPVVDGLLNETPPGSQRLLLSATLDGDVDKLVRAHLREPRLHELDPNKGAVTTMDHHVLVVGGFRDKMAAAAALVEANPRSIVFTRTREGATELAESLTDGGIEAVDLHGSLSQRVRERNLHKFTTGRAQVVVATDVAARGIHVDNVGLVVHYDAPTDAKAYLHRSGRTARAGESGAVITLTTPRRLQEVRRLQERAGVTARHHDIRTAPQPMTVAALAESGEEMTEERGPRHQRDGGGRRGPSGRPAGRPAGRGGYQRRDRDGGFDRSSDRGDRRDGGFRSDRGDRREGGFRGDRNDRSDRGQGGFRQDRNDRREGGNRGDRFGDRREGGFRNDRNDRNERNERSDRGYRQDRNDRNDRGDRREGGFRADRGDRGQGGYRQDRNDRGDRGPGGFRNDRNDRREGGYRQDRDDRGTRDDRGYRSERGPRTDRGSSGAPHRGADRPRRNGEKKPRWSKSGR